MRISRLCGVLLLMVCCCDQTLKINLADLSERSSIDLNEESFMLVIPQRGCSTCVKKSYDFILRHYANPKIKYVFTHYSSKKAVRVRLKVAGLKDPSHVGFIELGDALDLGLSQMYPSLIHIETPDLGEVVFMNAEDGSDWKKLEEAIAN